MDTTAGNGSCPVPVGPPPPFDPAVAEALASLPGPVREMTPDTLPQLRASLDEAGTVPLEQLTCGGAYRVEERTVPGPEGQPGISLLICLPTGTAGPVPALYHVHGGGMVLGDNRLGVPQMLDLADGEAAVISVEYRLAPEHPHPAPVEDCYAGLAWTAAHTAGLGIDPDRIVVAGSSAGGGLAAALALLARDRGGPTLLAQMLLYPMLDDRNDTPSARQMAGLGVWGRTANETGWNALLGEARGGPDVSPYAAPARAADLSGLPPAFIDVGSAETFRDEDIAYAGRIWQAGGVAELHVWPGGCHGFDGFAPHAAISVAATEARRQWLRRILTG